MSETVQTTVQMQDFAGVNLDAVNAADGVPKGLAQDIVNISPKESHKLVTRNGLKLVTFEAGG